MDIEINRLEKPYPYNQISELLSKIYFKDFGDQGTLSWDENYTRYYFEAHVDKLLSKYFAFAAFADEQLIGVLLGHYDLVRFENQLTFKTVNLGVMAVAHEFRRQGIAQKMLKRLIEEAEKRDIDLIFAFPEKGRYGDKLLKNHFAFLNLGKTKHLVKMMEKQGGKVLNEHQVVNPVLIKIASLFSRIPSIPEPSGIIKLATIKDLGEVLDLINTIASRMPFATVYTREGFGHTLEYFDKLPEIYKTPWGHQWFILEREGVIYATVNFRIETIAFRSKKDEISEIMVGMFSCLAFHETLTFEEKKQFIAAILRRIRSGMPEIGLTYITTLQHEMKVFKKLNFLDDSNSYYLYMKPLSEKAEVIKDLPKLNEYFLEYYR